MAFQKVRSLERSRQPSVRRFSDPKLMSKLMSGRLPTTAKLTKEARNELEFVVGPVGIEPTTSRL